jgi:hypothetical protein
VRRLHCVPEGYPRALEVSFAGVMVFHDDVGLDYAHEAEGWRAMRRQTERGRELFARLAA